MQRKVFLNRSPKTGNQRYTKFLLWAAVALVLLVLLTPLITRKKGDNVSQDRPVAEKGVVVREIPKTGVQLSDSAPPFERMGPGTAPGSPGETVAQGGFGTGLTGDATAPRAAVPTEGTQGTTTPGASVPGMFGASQRGSIGAPITADAVPGQTTAAAVPSASGERAVDKDGQTVPKDYQVATVAEPAPPAATRERPAPVVAPAKPEISSSWRYIVQIGSFKEKQNADDLQQALQNKGYDVVVKVMAHEKLGQLYVVQLQPVSDAGRAGELLQGVKKDAGVKPWLLKIPPGQ